MIAGDGRQAAGNDDLARRRPSLAACALRLAACALLLTAHGLLLASCGKRRPPLPPIERVPQRTDALAGYQRGNQIILTWPAPSRNAPDQSVLSIRRIDVYRLAESPAAPLALTEEQFAARSTLIGSVSYAEIQAAGPTLTYIDQLEFNPASQPARLRYAVRYVNAANQRAAFSNFFLIEPSPRIARPPANLQIDEAEDRLTLRWQPPDANVDASTPVNLLGYNVYRAASDKGFVKLNDQPLAATQYADRNFTFGQTYSYLVRAVSLGTGGSQTESLDSEIKTVQPRDLYPPSKPVEPRLGAVPGRISIFITANPERDVAGYNIYRSADPDLPLERWTRINGALVTRTTFEDSSVESGKKYYYYVTAVDTAGNTSAPSDVVSETVP
jgi:hypothetical protein